MADFHKANKDTLRSAAEGADTITFLAACPRPLEAGKVWFDREPRRTHMPFGGTSISASEKLELWRKCEEYVGGFK